jgi:hypothetical protein
MAKHQSQKKKKTKKKNPPVPKQKRIKLKFIRIAQRNIRSIDETSRIRTFGEDQHFLSLNQYFIGCLSSPTFVHSTKPRFVHSTRPRLVRWLVSSFVRRDQGSSLGWLVRSFDETKVCRLVG